MSYSYTSRPAASRVGRGASRAPATGGTEAAPTVGATAQAAAPQETVQRMDGFTKFVPDQKKREKIAKQAKDEEDNFKKYKDSQKLGHVSYVGTAGGGLSQTGATRQRVQQNKNAAISKRSTFQQHRTNEKQREQLQHNQHKAAARGQAERNESKESDRQARLDEDRRQKNDAFLKRFEKGSKS